MRLGNTGSHESIVSETALSDSIQTEQFTDHRLRWWQGYFLRWTINVMPNPALNRALFGRWTVQMRLRLALH